MRTKIGMKIEKTKEIKKGEELKKREIEKKEMDEIEIPSIYFLSLPLSIFLFSDGQRIQDRI